MEVNNKKKYIVEVPIVIYMTQRLELEAESVEQAREKAFAHVENEHPNMYDEGVDHDYCLDDACEMKFDVWEKEKFHVVGLSTLVLED